MWQALFVDGEFMTRHVFPWPPIASSSGFEDVVVSLSILSGGEVESTSGQGLMEMT